MDPFQDSSSANDADDNAFYQELTRQILMLTDEDDENKGVQLNGVAELRRYPVVYGGVESKPVARNYYSWLETGTRPVPISRMESLLAKGGGGGTGVFIPSGAATGRHPKKSGRRRYKNKAMKNNEKGRVFSAVG